MVYDIFQSVVAICILGLPLTLAQVPFPSSWVTVTGQVLDSQVNPVSNATISVLPLDVGISGGLPIAVTGKNGRFRMMSPSYPGRTRFVAVKEAAGYPDTQGLLFVSGVENKESRPEVLLSPPGAHMQVDIHLPPPDGILEATVIDAKTQAPISNARVMLDRDDHRLCIRERFPRMTFSFRIAASAD